LTKQRQWTIKETLGTRLNNWKTVVRKQTKKNMEDMRMEGEVNSKWKQNI
jgi:hypothetical protein